MAQELAQACLINLIRVTSRMEKEQIFRGLHVLMLRYGKQLLPTSRLEIADRAEPNSTAPCIPFYLYSQHQKKVYTFFS